MKIVSVDITENVVQVKVFDLYLGKHFTDYLALIKINDYWLIVNKMFHHQQITAVGEPQSLAL